VNTGKLIIDKWWLLLISEALRK